MRPGAADQGQKCDRSANVRRRGFTVPNQYVGGDGGFERFDWSRLQRSLRLAWTRRSRRPPSTTFSADRRSVRHWRPREPRRGVRHPPKPAHLRDHK